MKKTISTLSMLMAGLFAQYNAQAQNYVTLPDTSFRNYMRNLAPNCFNTVGELDTMAAANAEVYSVYLSGSLEDITGIHYFKKVKQIIDNDMTSLANLGPKLPPALEELMLTGTHISIIPSLPNTTKRLVVQYWSQHSLTLPPLPSSLEELVITKGTGFSLGSSLANTSLNQLTLEYCNLSSLPQLPYSLQELNVNNNNLSSLPQLSGLTQILNVNNNNLTSLPDNISYISLDCSNNPNLTCLPYLYPYISSLNISGTNITCLPNKPSGITSNLPICNPTNNPNSCPSFPYAVKGKVYKDLNNNGSYESNEPLVYSPIKVNGHSWVGYSYAGSYQIDIDTVGGYDVSVAHVPAYWTAMPASISVGFNSYGAIENQDFRLVPALNAKDLSLYQYVATARPGFNCPVSLVYENVGTVSTNVTAKFLKPIGYTVESASVSGYTISGDTLIWNLGILGVGQKGVVTVYGKIATNVALGTELNFESWVNKNDAQEQTATNNHSLVSQTVVGSYDPNDKQARKTISPAQIAAGEYIDYTIRFQNTGTDTAFSVVIADTLANALQANTLEMVASSHNVRTTLKNNVVYFEHLNIQLPDSNVNEKASHGFVSFRIKPQANLALGSIISNKAAIYFDYNAPVITNTAVTKVQNPTGIFDKINKTLAVYPNPVDKGVLYIPNMAGASATLTSLEGKELRSWSGIGESVSLEGIAQGMYLLKVTQKGESRTAKVMVK